MEESAIKKPTDPQFLQSIQAGLRYWQAKTQSLTPDQVRWLDDRRQNLHQAISFGLSRPETWEDTAVLLIQAFDFSEFRGYWPEWIEILEEALAHAPEKETEIYGRLQSELGQLYRLTHNFTTAINQHRQVLALAKKLGDRKLMAKAYLDMSETNLRSNKFDEAKKYGLIALEMVQAFPEEGRLHAVALKTLGDVSRNVGDYAAAEKYMREAIVQWQRMENAVYLARTLNDLGIIYMDQNKFEASEESYLKGYRILQPTTNVIDKERIQLNLGMLFYRQGRWEEAAIRFEHIDRTALREQNERGLISTTLNNLGNVYIKLNRFPEAELFLVQAIESWKELGNELDLANSLGSLAEVKVAIGQVDEAITLYQQSLALLANYPGSVWGQKLVREFETALNELSSIKN